MTVEEIKAYIKNAWSDVNREFLEYLRIKEIPAIEIKFDVDNNANWNMKSNAEQPYSILCFHGIYYAIVEALEDFNIEESMKDECTFTLLKMIIWHEIFHILLGHKITKDEKEKIKRDNEEIVLQQLEYIADGMAIRTYMPFIITNKDNSMQNENVMAQFLTLLYAYYLKMDKHEKIVGIPTNHPKSNVRFELLLMCASQFVIEWNKCVPEDKIDEKKVCDLCNENLKKANLSDHISAIDSKEEIRKIVDISYDHWIWKRHINPINKEFSFE